MKNKALLVGINKYPDPRNELRGCINDILDMEHFIAETNKVYAKQNIKKLTDRQATKKEIVSQIKWLVEGAAPGDQLLFHYSGHGAQLPCQKIAGDVWEEKDGLDEISIAAPTYVVELKDDEINEYTIDPSTYNLSHTNLEALVVDDALASLKLIKQAFAGQAGAPLDMLLLNAGAAIYCADLAVDLAAGIEQAKRVINSGSAQRKLDDLVHLTQGFNAS